MNLIYLKWFCENQHVKQPSAPIAFPVAVSRDVVYE